MLLVVAALADILNGEIDNHLPNGGLYHSLHAVGTREGCLLFCYRAGELR